jgi:hypothetical protein
MIPHISRQKAAEEIQMEEKDFQRIEQLVGKTIKLEVGQAVNSEIAALRQGIDTTLGQLRKDMNEDFRHHVGILSEDFQHKLQLVAEGHQMLSEKMERMHDGITKKINDVATDIAAHRADTEGHKKGYMIKEP